MTDEFDRDKVVDCMFDPTTSLILAELENGGKTCSYLAEKASISENEVFERLDYLIKHNFILQTTENGESVLNANPDKLAEIIENNENFGATIEGLEKMDSYLN